MRTLLCVLLGLLFVADSAQACNRCGLFGRRCRYQQQAYYYPVVKQAAVYPQQVINIANVYPQGNTVYSAGQLAQLYATDTNLAITSASRVADNAVQALTAAMKLGEANVGQVAEVAKLQAATEHLKAAMHSGESEASQLTLRITQSGGGIQVERVTDANAGGLPDEPPTAPAMGSLLAQKCAKCHGAALAQPKGGLFFDTNVNLTADQAWKAASVLSGHDVPEPMKALVEALTVDEKSRLFEEIHSLWKRDE